jgi:peptide chain release factor 2
LIASSWILSRSESPICGGIFDIDTSKAKIVDLEHSSADPSFWTNPASAQKVLKEIKNLKRTIEPWAKADRECSDIADLAVFASEEKDDSMLAELSTQLGVLRTDVEGLEFLRKMKGEDDPLSALLMIHSGAGGTESCDWCEMLHRMYTRWIERKGFKSQVIDIQSGDEAGLKSVTLEVQGEYAFGYLKAETGVHRLVRISPFDSNARRHTSFASVYAYPMYEETDDVEIDEKELRIDTYRSGGAGGQHVNKTDSAVRITHLPTGIVVACQNERSQIKNRSTAMRVLKSRLMQHFKEVEEKKRRDKAADKKKIEWGSQIRSYVLHPYNLVKDHRTDTETSNTQAVLDGDIDKFMESYLLNF